MAEQKDRRPGGKTEATFEDQDDQLLAKLAVRHEYISLEQLHEALSYQREQKNRGEVVTLEEVFLATGMISREQLESLSPTRIFMQRRQSERALSKAAISNGLVDQQQVDEAMQQQVAFFRQSKPFKPLVDIWVDTGVITPQQRAALLSAEERLDQEQLSGKDPEQKDRIQELQETDELAGEAMLEKDHAPGTSRPDSVAADANFDLVVSADKLEANLVPKENSDEAAGLQAVKALLESAGISYGVVDDELIEAYLRERAGADQPFQIARGTPPQPGRDAELEYFFEDYLLCIGTMDEKGRMDFRDRGHIPFVNEGDVVAKKIPRVEESPGVDVYGKEISVEKSRDKQFVCGSGTKITDDKLQVIATTSGRPQLSPVGKLGVCPEMDIPGDVDLETGNIVFDGIIHVHGVVQDGFQVHGRGLVAEEISRAFVEVTGDVLVRGGILGATVKAEGNVTASHIHGASIEAMGNIKVTNSVVDSKLSTTGKCLAERGAILSSKISARGGIDAKQIGSEASTPCVLTIGGDSLGKKKMATVRSQIGEKQLDKNEHLKNIAELEAHLSEMDVRIGELVQLQDRGPQVRKGLEKDLERAKGLNQHAQVAQLEQTIAQLDEKIKSAEQDLQEQFGRQDALKEKLSEVRDTISGIEQEIETLNNELTAINEWLGKAQDRVGVKVRNNIYRGTNIQGGFSAIVVDTDMQRVFIREVKGLDPAGGVDDFSEPGMQITKLL